MYWSVQGEVENFYNYEVMTSCYDLCQVSPPASPSGGSITSAVQNGNGAPEPGLRIMPSLDAIRANKRTNPTPITEETVSSVHNLNFYCEC